MRRVILCAAALLAGTALQACTGSELALMGADAASQLTSGRTLAGNLIHVVTGKDCVPVNVLAGRPMCTEEKETAAAEPEPVYCYRTLGQVDCHAEPDPMMSPTTRLYRTEIAAGPAVVRPPAE